MQQIQRHRHLQLPPYLFFTIPKPPLNLLSLHPRHPHCHRQRHRHRRPLLLLDAGRPSLLPARCFSSDEFPVDETFLQNFGPKDEETEDEARRRNWIERGWAPWEEVLTPEADFARKSLNEGEEVPLQSPDAIEAFRMLNPRYREQRMKEMGLTEDEWYRKQFEIKGEIPERLSTLWAGPVVVRQVAPRDWPPMGWEVDRDELRFIREGHRMMSERVDSEDLESRVSADTDDMCLERYKVFLKQYKEWVEANKDRLEEESYKVLFVSSREFASGADAGTLLCAICVSSELDALELSANVIRDLSSSLFFLLQYDQDYHPGRRKRGKDYKEGMVELISNLRHHVTSIGFLNASKDGCLTYLLSF